ncbi:MAG: arginase family protein [Thermoleophilaceae bacterium]
MSAPWTVVGAPLNSSGTGGGEEAGPDAYRAAGLAERVRASGQRDVDARITTSERDAETGVIGFRDLVAACSAVRDVVADELRAGNRPLVVGGDCSFLPGALAAARSIGARPGLAFVDGHLDFYSPHASPTGEAADMDLAIVLGTGPDELTHLAGEPPLVDPGAVVVLGHRDPDEPAIDPTSAPGLAAIDAATLLNSDLEHTAQRTLDELLGQTDSFWLHLDLDVLDERVLPAVSYSMPGGLDWAQLDQLLGPLLRSERLLGLSVADLRPDLDPDGRYAERVVALLERHAARR